MRKRNDNWRLIKKYIGGIRFVYHESDKQISVTLENSDKNPWLIKTAILPSASVSGAAEITAPFVATPTLSGKSGDKQKLKTINDFGRVLPSVPLRVF